MNLALRDWHLKHGAEFLSLEGDEAAASYGNLPQEYKALAQSAGVLDLSSRGRLCLSGQDRVRFLNGQVTNNVAALEPGQGCYAAITNAKGKMEGDAALFLLPREILIDVGAGMAARIQARLEKYIISEEVQAANVSEQLGCWSVQGPRAAAVLADAGFEPPPQAMEIRWRTSDDLGEVYLANHPRTGSEGFDLFVQRPALEKAGDLLRGACLARGGALAGWRALELARIAAGIPRFGADMDETNLAPEAGIEAQAISFTKGCYVGQEVISRIRSHGQVAKALRVLSFAEALPALPVKGDPLLHEGKSAGYVTSAAWLPGRAAPVGMGYVRREVNSTGQKLTVKTAAGEFEAVIRGFPLEKNFA